MDPISRFSNPTKHVVQFSGVQSHVLAALAENQENFRKKLNESSQVVFGRDSSVDLFVRHSTLADGGLVELRTTGPEQAAFVSGFFKSVLLSLTQHCGLKSVVGNNN